MRRALFIILIAQASLAAPPPSTIANDDSCDISLLPAATLLLPYFEVDTASPQTIAQTTLFSVQNTTALPQIARVTLWTDWGFPMLTFNLFLTGYDTQAINLYDVFHRGVIAPSNPPGTSNTTKPGNLSQPNDQNPHFLGDAAATCASNPGQLSAALLTDLQAAFTTGKVSAPGCAIVNDVGGKHANVVGYATIDVVANCNPTSPLDSAYFAREILFDNVLIGDYQHVTPNPAIGNYASGNPMVHIRAVPEGGAAGASVATALPYTFYDLYTTGTASRRQDRRQPLPSAFMPRFIQGGVNYFNTNFKIWREAIVAPTRCPLAYASNAAMPGAEAVRFDEHENPQFEGCFVTMQCVGPPALPATSSVSAASSIFPPFSPSGDVGGWFFLNLNNGGSNAYSSTIGHRASQAWVVTEMFAEGRYSVEMDAVAVGNGCSPAPALSSRTPIGPAP